MSQPSDADHDSAKPNAASSASTPSTPPRSIRGLRVMAVARWILLLIVTLVAARTIWTFWGPGAATHSSQQEDHFYCPMHPQIRSPAPGECPICHMDLEPIPAERRSDAPPAASPSTMSAAPHDVVVVSMSTEKQQAIGVTSSAVTREALGGSLRVPGVVNAPETGLAQVRVRAAGFVEKVAVSQTGVRVTRGQTLAWIYSPEIYRAQEEFLAATRWNAAAAPSGSPASPATEIAIAARRGLELLGLENADLEELVRTGHPIRSLPVRAPSSGYVTRFNAVLGFRADPETVLYEMSPSSRGGMNSEPRRCAMGSAESNAINPISTVVFGGTPQRSRQGPQSSKKRSDDAVAFTGAQREAGVNAPRTAAREVLALVLRHGCDEPRRVDPEVSIQLAVRLAELMRERV